MSFVSIMVIGRSFITIISIQVVHQLIGDMAGRQEVQAGDWSELLLNQVVLQHWVGLLPLLLVLKVVESCGSPLPVSPLEVVEVAAAWQHRTGAGCGGVLVRILCLTGIVVVLVLP